jgi:hypothetical protein
MYMTDCSITQVRVRTGSGAARLLKKGLSEKLQGTSLCVVAKHVEINITGVSHTIPAIHGHLEQTLS